MSINQFFNFERSFLKAKKSYGQHFLTNERIAERIADGLTLTDDVKYVVEVGPGKGMLTKYLLAKPTPLRVVEADRDMVEHLERHFPKLHGCIVADDILRVELDVLTNGEPFALIGNFPYNISSQILFKMLDYRVQIPEMVGMFQREVAERVVAPAGSKTYGVISVLIQAYYEGKVLFGVEPGSFSPPPKVQSAVIRLVRRPEAALGCDAGLFSRIVKQTFQQRRKMLRNTMKFFLPEDPILDDVFFNQRPEQLTVADFVKLTNWVSERK